MKSLWGPKKELSVPSHLLGFSSVSGSSSPRHLWHQDVQISADTSFLALSGFTPSSHCLMPSNYHSTGLMTLQGPLTDSLCFKVECSQMVS